MWKLYERLIQAIPTDWTADELVKGSEFFYVKSRSNIGTGGFGGNSARPPISSRNLEGAPLCEVATLIRSWNLEEAALGLAAINAYYNHPDVARAAGVNIDESRHVEDRVYDPFIMSQNEIRGKKVSILGHFPHLETLFEPICDMAILSVGEPEDGDYPLAAAEYLLPESEYVFLSSASLADKTLPRLLELSRNARKITIVGPSTPLAPMLFEYGVHDLAGFIFKDCVRATRLLRGAEHGKIYSTGQKVSLKAPGFGRPGAA